MNDNDDRIECAIRLDGPDGDHLRDDGDSRCGSVMRGGDFDSDVASRGRDNELSDVDHGAVVIGVLQPAGLTISNDVSICISDGVVGGTPVPSPSGTSTASFLEPASTQELDREMQGGPTDNKGK